MNTGRTQTKRCVVNLSTKKYWKGQERLIKSLQGNTDADLLMFKTEKEVNAPLHKDNMYAFKPFSFSKALSKRYESVLWLDASMFVLKDITPIFEEIEQQGYFWQSSGWDNKTWTTDRAKDYFGTDEGDMISSGVIGLNFKNDIAFDFFVQWNESMIDGMFNGSHEDYRHDQSCASLIIEDMKLKITPNNTFWSYGNPKDNFTENILIVANGIC